MPSKKGGSRRTANKKGKSSRVITPRRTNVIEKVEMIEDDGFTYKVTRKRPRDPKAAKTQAKAKKSKPAARSKKSSSSSNSQKKQAGKQATKKKQSATKGKRQTAKVQIPSYPKVALPDIDIDADTPRQVAIQRFFEAILEEEVNAVQDTFTGPLDFVSKGAEEVCSRFLANLQETYVVDSVKRLRQKELKANPINEERLGAIKRTQKWIQSAQGEVDRLEALKQTWANKDFLLPAISANEDNDTSEMPSIDKEFFEAYKHASLQGDYLLDLLKKVQAGVDNAAAFQQSLRKKASSHAKPRLHPQSALRVLTDNGH